MSRAFSLAGFEVTLIGRFWVTTEGNHHYCSIFSRNDGQQSVSVRCTTLSANDLIARLITDPPSESVLESVSAVRIGLGLMHLVDVSTRQNGMRFQIIFEVKHPE